MLVERLLVVPLLVLQLVVNFAEDMLDGIWVDMVT